MVNPLHNIKYFRLKAKYNAKIYLNIYALFLFIIVLSRCGSTSTEQNTYSVKTIVYGNVSHLDSSGYQNVGVQIFHYPGGCNSFKVQKPLGFGLIEKTGQYKIILKQAFIGSKLDCYKALLVNFKGDTLRIGNAKKFNPVFHPHPPYDSVRIDFTYPIH